MTEEKRVQAAEGDRGLHRLLAWTLIALVLVVLLAFAAVHLAVRFFDPAS